MQNKPNWRKYPYKTGVVQLSSRGFNYAILRKQARSLKSRINKAGGLQVNFYFDVRSTDLSAKGEFHSVVVL